MKKFTVVCFLLCMVIQAAGDGVEPEGIGTEDEPFLVGALDNLLWMSTNEDSWDCWFEQIDDIDAAETLNWNSGAGLSPIGWWESAITNQPFTGHYKGNYHKISNLYINRGSEDAVGLFGYAVGAELVEIVLTGAEVSGDDYVACLIGYNQVSTIDNCSIEGTSNGDWCTALLCGYCNGWGITLCFVSGEVHGSDYAGGLIGKNLNYSTVEQSCSSGEVYGENKVGGLIGHNLNSSIYNCYSTASVQGENYIGGLLGHNQGSQINQCYSSGNVEGVNITGGLAGYNNNFIIDCIWNTETSGQDVGVGLNENGEIETLLGMTIAEMQFEGSYLNSGWDFVGEDVNGTEDIWIIEEGINAGFAYIAELTWAIADNILHAFFRADNREVFIQEEVQFINLSCGEAVQWEWDFEYDGVIDSTEPEPVWVYPEEGIYSVSLKVSDETGNTQTMVREDYIAVTNGGMQPEGDGSEIAPFQIFSLNNLIWLSSHPEMWDRYFMQIADINASETQEWNEGRGFSPIGNYENGSFTGHYNGDDNRIDSLYINRPESSVCGFFGYTHEAQISNLRLTNVNISGDWCVGGIVGECYSNTRLSDCYVSGLVNGEMEVGALVGLKVGIEVDNCFYDRESFLINGETRITLGALSSAMFTEWLANDLSLNIDNYLASEDGYYLINSLADLEEVSAFVYNDDLAFKLTADLDLAGNPGFYFPFFCGCFNGDGHQISNLFLDMPDLDQMGLFGYMDDGTITGLRITNAQVNGFVATGALAGLVYRSEISDCYADGAVNCENSGGMLCGSFVYDSILSNCGAGGDVYSGHYAGGLLGYIYENVTIDKCFSECNVEADYQAGGLIGIIKGSLITNCYATGEVQANMYAGGFCGYCEDSELSECYAAGFVAAQENSAGFAASNSMANISNSVWNSETSGQSVAIAENQGTTSDLISCTTDEMQQMSTFTDLGWDFVGETVNGSEDIWDIELSINQGFPYICGLEWADSDEEELTPSTSRIMIYPNPFNPLVNISFQAQQKERVKVEIYNVKGQRIDSVYDEQCSAGKNNVFWDAGENPSGIYLIRIQGKSWQENKKITLLK
ncbi:MAG: T9SS type A sorting domain-containing protein [Candidatus Cloacimonetes bacterium]|nr:T9SS type A sorting domain-containing protein [Candidatus Cloacimonadota bacterium]